jgi:hypothetical protein
VPSILAIPDSSAGEGRRGVGDRPPDGRGLPPVEGDKCAQMAAELDKRRYVATRTPETAMQEELVPTAKVLSEVAELAPSEQADQALVL